MIRRLQADVTEAPGCMEASSHDMEALVHYTEVSGLGTEALGHDSEASSLDMETLGHDTDDSEHDTEPLDHDTEGLGHDSNKAISRKAMIKKAVSHYMERLQATI